MTRAHFEDKVGIWQLRNEITIQVAHARHFFFFSFHDSQYFIPSGYYSIF